MKDCLGPLIKYIMRLRYINSKFPLKVYNLVVPHYGMDTPVLRGPASIGLLVMYFFLNLVAFSKGSEYLFNPRVLDFFEKLSYSSF